MTRASTRSSTLTKEEMGKLRTAISIGPLKPFLVTLERSSDSCMELTPHVARETTKASCAINTSSHLMKRDFSRQISALGFDVAIRFKLHSRYALDKPRSLEAFIAKFGSGERVYDPLGVFDEAERLIDFACKLRRQLEGDLKGIYWSSRWRTTYVLLNEDAFVDGHCLRRGKLIAAERSVIDAYEASAASHDRAGLSDRLETAVLRNVRLCFDVPVVPLVPVDEASLFTHERARGLGIPKLPRFLELARLAKVSILSGLLGMGSAGVAVAKLPPIENGPMLTGADTAIALPTVTARDTAALSPSGVSDLFLGGPGLHLLWRDPIHGAVGRNAAFNQAAPGTHLTGSADGISRDHFFDVSKSGATFSAPAYKTHSRELDLRWLAHGERVDGSGPNESTGWPRPSAFPAMQPGVMAVLGLSSLIGSDVSDEAYSTLVQDLQIHFGLPRSLRAEARWHFGNTAHSATPSNLNQDILHHKVPLDQSDSYWEWLRRMASRESSNEGRDYRRYPNNPLLRWYAKCKPGSSSC
jgi:hypothetical protein